MQTPTSVKVNELPKKLVSVNSILGRFEHGPFSSEYLRDVNLAQQVEESQARQGINFSVFPVKEIFRLIQNANEISNSNSVSNVFQSFVQKHSDEILHINPFELLSMSLDEDLRRGSRFGRPYIYATLYEKHYRIISPDVAPVNLIPAVRVSNGRRPEFFLTPIENFLSTPSSRKFLVANLSDSLLRKIAIERNSRPIIPGEKDNPFLYDLSLTNERSVTATAFFRLLRRRVNRFLS